ncbi:MAG: glycerophosphodiester phosphodiesterase [Chitinophagaceae bacterium]|nr:glycerophosphodiester phosphodiesterase [Chitinophagaceae bacterium]
MTEKTYSGKAGFANNTVVAHRGAWKQNNLPQNSIASLKQAIALGCAGSEFDVRMTADDTLVVNHDPDYNKMRDDKSMYTQLSSVKLPNGEMLPTLREYIMAGIADNKETMLVIEIKPSDVSKDRAMFITEKVVNLVHELNAEKMVCYISFDFDMLKKIREKDPAAIVQYLEGNKTPQELKNEGINGADYHYSVYKKKPEWIEIARKQKILLNAWTVNEKQDLEWLLVSKFDYITTNEPELLLRLSRK